MYMHIYANLPLWHMSQVNLNIQFDISQKIFQRLRTSFERLSTIEPFLKISAHSNHFLNISAHSYILWFIYMHPSTSCLAYFVHCRSTRTRIQLTFMREIYLHSCKGIYTAPLLARALVYGVEKHLVIHM